MGLIFTDPQLSDISLEYVAYPTTRAVLVAGKAKLVIDIAGLLETDTGNKVWTDFYRDDVLTHYHSEKELLDRITKTLYPGESLIDAGAQKDEVHFPATPPDVWKNLVPKKVDSNTGLPTSAFGSDIDGDKNTAVDDSVALIKNGFDDGNVNTDTTNTYVVGATTLDLDDVTDAVIGQRLLVIAGTDGMLCKITGINQDAGFCTGEATPPQLDQVSCEGDGGVWSAPSSGSIDIEVIVPPSANLGSGASVNSEATGFTNGEREGTTGITASRQVVLDIFKGIVDASVQAYEDFLSGTLSPVITLNEDQKRGSEVQAAQDDITNAVVVIDDWQSFPSLKTFGPTVESRFGDIKLSDLTTEMDARETFITARIAEITAAIGTLTQAVGDGSFAGGGVYFDYFEWINKRINGASGSLAKYYNSLIALEVIDQQIENLDTNRTEQDTTFRIEPFDADFVTSNQILVTNTVGFSIGNTIKVFAEGQPTLTVIITDILAGTIEIDQNLTPDYSLENVARILKQF